MYRYIFGFDKTDPVNCARELKRKGIHAIVTDASGAQFAPLLSDEGLDVYLCFGAFSLDNDINANRYCADASGNRRVWFSSGCPNDAALAEKRIHSILECVNPYIKGIFVDGARFASFASSEGTDAFFTCFCPRCMEKMHASGLDAQDIRACIASLKHHLPDDMHLIRDWLSFRSTCVKQYMAAFAQRVHALDPSLKAGAFIFEPFLGPFVGQTMDACASLDIIAPMLYRNYPHADGPACMGHEWSALYRMFGDGTPDFVSVTGLEGHPLPKGISYTAEAVRLLSDGFCPSDVGRCIKTARSLLKPRQLLWPIIQIEDNLLECTERCSFENGSDAIGYFAYSKAHLPDKNF